MRARPSLTRTSAYLFFGMAITAIVWIGISLLMSGLNDSWAEIRLNAAGRPERYIAPWALDVGKVIIVLCGMGLAGLVLSGLLRMLGTGAERVKEAPLGALAHRVVEMSEAGMTRTQMGQELLARGVAQKEVDAALTLGWPLGAHCPRCKGDLRPFSYVSRYGGREIYHCGACEWSGEVEPARA